MKQDSNAPSAWEQVVAAMPVTERRLELAGVSTAVLEGGDGPPIVLLHGQGEFAAVWINVLDDLVKDFRVIVPDLPGHGASTVSEHRLDTDVVLSWVGELIDRTCAVKPVLVGHLLGGSIAARFAVAHGDRLAHLVLLDSMGLGWFRPAPKFAVPMVRFIARPTPRSRDRFFDQCFLDSERVVEAVGDPWEALKAYALDRARDHEVGAAIRRLMPRLGVPAIPRGDLGRITVPTTLIHGRHDLQINLRTAEAAAARYGWPLHVIEDCRDDPAAEQPEAFLEALYRAIGMAPKKTGV